MSRISNSGSYFITCKWCGERIHMREMPYGQWLAFNANDSVHTHDGPSGYDNTTSSVSHGLQPPTPPFVPKSAASPVHQNQKTWSPPEQKKNLPDWINTLIGWIVVLLIVYLIAKK